MKRKIVKQGAATMTISLPAKWCKNFELKNGDEIELEEKEDKLVISSHQIETAKKIKIDLRDLDDRVIRWMLSAMHKSGFNEIELIFNRHTTLNIIREVLKDLYTGFAIIEQSDKRCVLRSITKDDSEEFDNILRRAFLVTLSLGESSLELIKKKQFEDLKEIISLEKTNNKLTNYCERLVNMKGYKNTSKSSFIYVIIWNLEKVCDDYRNICVFLTKNNVKVSDKLIKLFEKTNKILREFYETFYKFDTKKLNKINEDIKKILDVSTNYLTVSDKERVIVLYLLSMLVKIADFSPSTIALNM